MIEIPNENTTSGNWDRELSTHLLHEFENGDQDEGTSQREFANLKEIHRSTLQHWINRKNDIHSHPDIVNLFESPVGLALLQRIVVAACFVMNQCGALGIRYVTMFLRLSGLDAFTGSSTGSIWKLVQDIEEQILVYEQKVREELKGGVEGKEVSIAFDETFHRKDICLVAMDLVSGFIFLQQYEESRDAGTWKKAMEQVLDDLKVKILQGVSDEAGALKSLVENIFKTFRGSDLFHVHYEISKAMGRPLGKARGDAEKAMAEETQKIEKAQKKLEQTLEKPKYPPSTRLKLEHKIQEAQEAFDKALQRRKEATDLLERKKKASKKISQATHIYDLETGAPREAAGVEKELNEAFDELEEIAEEGQLRDKSKEKLRKARRLIPTLVSAIVFAIVTIKARLDALGLSSELRELMETCLVPGCYLELVHRRSGDAEERQALKERSRELLSPLLSPDGPLNALGKEEKERLLKEAMWCANVYQRSTSALEGINGHIEWHRRGRHVLSDKKLRVLLAIWNYFIRGPDGRTSAERFFEAAPPDLFEWLLNHVPVVCRPAKRRSKGKRSLLEELFEAA